MSGVTVDEMSDLKLDNMWRILCRMGSAWDPHEIRSLTSRRSTRITAVRGKRISKNARMRPKKGYVSTH